MAVIHCTRKLAAKLSAGPGGPETSPLGSWHASLVRFDRRQCAMFCHDETRYCLFLPGLRASQLADLGRWHRDLFLASLRIEGAADAAIERAGVALGAARFDSATDRSVLASMNIALRDLEPLVHEERDVMDLDPLLVARRLNERPARANSVLLWPGREMRERVAQLQAAGAAC